MEPSSSKTQRPGDKMDLTNQTNSTNQKDQTDQTNQTDQTQKDQINHQGSSPSGSAPSPSEVGITLVPRGDVAWLEWDLPGEKVNKLSSSVMRGFEKLIEELEKSSYKAVVLISRKKNIFIAGADIEEIQRTKNKDEFERNPQNRSRDFQSF